MVLQRVTRARVRVGDEELAAIGAGLVALVGVAAGDGPGDARLLARKTAALRIFAAEHGARPFDRCLGEVPGAALLCVSQFTLLGDVRRGNRPSWSEAAEPVAAEGLVEAYAAALEALGVRVGRGRFGAAMAVELENDGPVTILLDSRQLAGPRGAGGG